jgi:transposase
LHTSAAGVLPERHGDWKATHKLFRRWCESGVFARALGALALDADAEYMSIDSTSVRAHQHSAGAQKRRRGSSHRQILRRADDQDPRHRRSTRQSRGAVAHAGPGGRYHTSGAVARPDKLYRARATRYDKLANTFLAAVALVCVLFWLN